MGGKRVDYSRLIGTEFGRLLVLSVEDKITYKPRRLFCRCACGEERSIAYPELRSGDTRSCGCLSKETLIARSTTHGYSNEPLFQVWTSMIFRCTKSNYKQAADYLGRGINVCKSWVEDYKVFKTWALENGYLPELQINRKDNDLGYTPDNCNFITACMNMHNTRLLRSDNVSGYRGSSLTYSGSYAAHCSTSLSGTKLRFKKCGFKTVEAAAKYRDAYCVFNDIPLTLNFPEMTREEAQQILERGTI